MGYIEYETADDVVEMRNVSPEYDAETECWSFPVPADRSTTRHVPRERVLLVETG
jgi:hypothetical protein